MNTAVDTNIIVALWDSDQALSALAQSALDGALAQGKLLVAAPVFGELLAFPGRSEAFLDSFFRDTGIQIEWNIDETVWRAAGRAFQTYAARRRKSRVWGPHCILADFLIGAHASEGDCRLLTLDDRLYRAAFPHLRILRAV
ncbi:MAG TPA: PIN domain-containing protein [Terriglobia bacterium]|nr:PIN domain-containing protein [Terriglobia bacterium]